MKRPRSLATIALLGLLACGPGEPPLERYELGGDFELTDHHGQPFALQQCRGRPLLLFFGFSSCADVCPTTLSRIGQVQTALPTAGIEVLFVSVDPVRDTPARLAEYVDGYPYRLTGLTGSREQITALARRYAAGFEPSAAGTVDHSSRIYLIDSQGLVRYLFSATDSVGDMADVIRRLL